MRILFFIFAFFTASIIMGCSSTPDKIVITEEKKVPFNLPESTFTHFAPPLVVSEKEYLDMQQHQRENYLAKKVAECVAVIGIANKRLVTIKKSYTEYLQSIGENNAQSTKTNP